ncbi:hypothetical protein BAAM1489_01550 [Bifidobacterium animalis subsp. animalis MCC 1489]|uniref:Uncharacterized protein n=1 Tax=Bifidobacterium animalis subsp. animalis IM386 TaxID=1402194 RepID=A0AAV2W0G9_9BIFI|nr:hypothetical protein [Bifidobacterium animalis]AFI63719.1 hypothetical protein BANAN_07600 [Bifidobacterium animalis subsp. animalis ATCC 25527]AYN24338.1 hypothetical protein CNCMI4602_1506 [Bifidobacterium animalis subsp. animalis]KFI41849.1 hypothetical protein BASA_1462 [Bifidobacterium animalis subsp. animalis]KOA64570.1 hypothetical protein BAAM1489_01550 [Bifidobacterium animalis subsp. animalis MCC 1489]CDI66934.1 Uncharacterized protein BANIM336_00233 [Bifidobacterium animalis subs
MHYFTPKRCETTTKIMYYDRQTAWQAAEQSRIERGVELWVYQCQYCGQWHLTHRDPALAQAVGHFKRSQKPYSRKKGFKPRRR